MTTTISDDVERQIWSSMPGWGIAADLTPTEVVERRRVRALRKVSGAGLALVLLLCVAGFALSMIKTQGAEDSLTTAQDRTNVLLAQQGEFSDVVKLQTGTRTIDAQIAALMKSDVDVAALVARMRQVLPGDMSLTSINVTLSSASETVLPQDTTTAGAQAAGSAPIGTVNLAGTSRELSDLATYVSNLERTDGIVEVLPESNATSEAGDAAWSVSLKLSDELYTHRYDVDKQTDGGTQ